MPNGSNPNLPAGGAFLQPDSDVDALRDEAMAELAELSGRARRLKDGLHHKYDVVKRSTGEKVTDCFVLRPSTDPAARAAMREYARVTPHPELAVDLIRWVNEAEGGADV